MKNRLTLKPIACGIVFGLTAACSDGTFHFRERSPISEVTSAESAPASINAEGKVPSEVPNIESPVVGNQEQPSENCPMEPDSTEMLDQVPKTSCTVPETDTESDTDSETETESPNQST